MAASWPGDADTFGVGPDEKTVTGEDEDGTAGRGSGKEKPF